MAMVSRRQLCLVAICTIGNALLAPTVPGCSLTNCRAKSGGFGATANKAPSKKSKAKAFTKKQTQLEAGRIEKAPARCLCHSGLEYKVCCAPCHAKTTTAATPEALLRSRYAAFSLELPSYLAANLGLGAARRATSSSASPASPSPSSSSSEDAERVATDSSD